jgi:hypothetical protein
MCREHFFALGQSEAQITAADTSIIWCPHGDMVEFSYGLHPGLFEGNHLTFPDQSFRG